MTENQAITTYYKLDGVLTKEIAGEDHPVTKEEANGILQHLVFAMHVYEKEGFRFVDMGANATLQEGKIGLEWSDYGLTVPVAKPIPTRKEAEGRE